MKAFDTYSKEHQNELIEWLEQQDKRQLIDFLIWEYSVKELFDELANEAKELL